LSFIFQKSPFKLDPMKDVEMQYERIYFIWDIYDGPRTGVADYLGFPHFFERTFDDGTDEYENWFSLNPISVEVLKRAMLHWSVYRDFHFQYRSGAASQDAHPGNDDNYQKEGAELEKAFRNQKPLTGKFIGNFRWLEVEDDLPPGEDQEVFWQSVE